MLDANVASGDETRRCDKALGYCPARGRSVTRSWRAVESTEPMTATNRSGSNIDADHDAMAAMAAMADRIRRGLRLFSSSGDQPRARRATDVVLLTISFVGIVLVGLIAVPEPGFSRAITSFLSALPTAMDGMWQILGDLPALWGLVVLVEAFARSGAKVGREMVPAIIVGVVLRLVLGRVVTGAWPPPAGAALRLVPRPELATGRRGDRPTRPRRECTRCRRGATPEHSPPDDARARRSCWATVS